MIKDNCASADFRFLFTCFQPEISFCLRQNMTHEAYIVSKEGIIVLSGKKAAICRCLNCNCCLPGGEQRALHLEAASLKLYILFI